MRADVFEHKVWEVRADFVASTAGAGAAVPIEDAIAGSVYFSAAAGVFAATTGIRFQVSNDGLNFTDAAADGTVFGDQAGATHTVAAGAVVAIPPSIFGFRFVRIKPASNQPAAPVSYAIFTLKA